MDEREEELSLLEIDAKNALYYEYDPPSAPDGKTFVFINPITGDCSLWQGQIGPALRKAGHGTLVYNFRGQAKSSFDPAIALDDELITADLMRVIAELKIDAPIVVGLSIGGLYAIRAHAQGLKPAGVVLVNTLRKMSPRIDWMNRMCVRLMQQGGPTLLRDVASHVITSEAMHAAMIDDIFGNPSAYEGLAEDAGFMNLVTHMAATSWDMDLTGLDLPVLVTTGYQDRVFYNPADVDALFAELPQGLRLDMPQAGHMIPAERPKEFILALMGFADIL